MIGWLKSRSQSAVRLGFLIGWMLALLTAAAAQDTVRLPALIYDAKPENQKEPYFFRTSKDALKPGKDAAPSREGLDTLKASGSASFSEESLDKILKKLGERKIVMVDLRQESHGFLNGLAVMWWSERNGANKDKSLAQIERDEAERLQALKKAGAANVERLTINDQDKTFERKKPEKVKVQDIVSEAELCKARKLGYVRIPVTDRDRPDDAEVDRFVRFVRELPNDQWLHFHCKAGHGRTTTFMAMYDMMRNAKKVSQADILKRQYLLGGIDLTTDPEKTDWRYSGAVDRRKFLEKFHQYCKANDDGFRTSWSEWLAKQEK
jgi:hypothetical protein